MTLQRYYRKFTVFKGFYNTDFQYFNKSKLLETDCFSKPTVGFNPISIIHSYYEKPILQNIYSVTYIPILIILLKVNQLFFTSSHMRYL